MILIKDGADELLERACGRRTHLRPHEFNRLRRFVHFAGGWLKCTVRVTPETYASFREIRVFTTAVVAGTKCVLVEK